MGVHNSVDDVISATHCKSWKFTFVSKTVASFEDKIIILIKNLLKCKKIFC